MRSFFFWSYIVAVAIFLFNATIICVRAFRSQGRDRKLLLIVASLTAFTTMLITVFYFTSPYR